MFFLRFLIVVALMYSAFVLQTSRAFAFLGVQPNLLLVGFLILISVLENTRKGGMFLISVGVSTLGLIALFFSFWFLEALFVLVLALIIFYARRFLTGERVTDFFLAVFGATVIFYLILYSLGLGRISGFMVLGEAVGNFVLGLPLWYFLKKWEV